MILPGVDLDIQTTLIGITMGGPTNPGGLHHTQIREVKVGHLGGPKIMKDLSMEGKVKANRLGGNKEHPGIIGVMGEVIEGLLVMTDLVITMVKVMEGLQVMTGQITKVVKVTEGHKAKALLGGIGINVVSVIKQVILTVHHLECSPREKVNPLPGI